MTDNDIIMGLGIFGLILFTVIYIYIYIYDYIENKRTGR